MWRKSSSFFKKMSRILSSKEGLKGFPRQRSNGVGRKGSGGWKWTVDFRNREESLFNNDSGVLLRSLDFI